MLAKKRSNQTILNTKGNWCYRSSVEGKARPQSKTLIRPKPIFSAGRLSDIQCTMRIWNFAKCLPLFLLTIVPICAHAQTWKINGIDPRNFAQVQSTIGALDGVSEFTIDLEHQTLSIVPKPRAVINSDE